MKYKALITRKVHQYQEVEVEIPDNVDPVEAFWDFYQPTSTWKKYDSDGYDIESLSSETEILIQDGEEK